MLKNRIIYNEFSDWGFDLSKAKRSYLWDVKGKKYIDFTSGWNVTNLGWNHPEVTAAVIAQAKKSSYAPMWTADPIQNSLARELTDSLPSELRAVGRVTGGTEANEEAMKTARAYTRRKKIIGFKDTYHGQSFGVMALGFLPGSVKAISPLVGGVLQIDFPSTYRSTKSERQLLSHFTSELEKILAKRDIAAVVTEAGIITGWGSTYVAPGGFLTAIRRLTKKYGTLLILDEVGTGFSRCGKLFGMQLEGVTPDIATFAKGFSNGAVAIGAMVTTTKIAEKTVADTNLTSTFGWTPVACAAALKTLQIHKRDRVWKKAERDGKYFVSELRRELGDHPRVGDIRGVGMEIGIDFVKDKKSKKPDKRYAKKVIKWAFRRGLHLVLGDSGNIQLMPPLTIERGVLDKGIEIFVDTIQSVSQ